MTINTLCHEQCVNMRSSAQLVPENPSSLSYTYPGRLGLLGNERGVDCCGCLKPMIYINPS
jgi:hypothetical protein